MQIDFPTSSYPGTIPQEGAGRLINAIPEKLGDGLKYIRSPGVIRWGTTPPADNVTNFRGAAFMNNTLWVAYAEQLYYTTAAAGNIFTKVPSGAPSSLIGSDPVFFAVNQKSPIPDMVAVKSAGGAFVITPTSITDYGSVDTDLPSATTVDVCFGFGFFFFAVVDGRCFASGLNTTTINAIDFTTAQAKSDRLYRCVFFQQQLYLIGPDSIEVWGQPVNAVGFPFNLVAVIPRGILNPRCVTGHENGFDLGLVILASNNEVMRLNGFQPERISEPDLERAIARLTDKSTIEMTSFAAGGHMYLKVKSPLWCWIYDFSAGSWHERASYLSNTSRLKQAVYCPFPSPAASVWLIGDENSADIGSISGRCFTEFNNPLAWVMHSKPVTGFPSRVVCGPAHFHFVPGTGNYDQPMIAMAGVATGNPLVVSTVGLHNLIVGDTVFFTGIVGMEKPAGVSQMNGRQLLVAAPINPTSFAVTDLNGNAIDSTAWSAYTGGGTIRKQNVPRQQSNPIVEINWSDDGGLNYHPSQARNLGALGDSTNLIRTYLTGSISPYGRVWRLVVTDPVYVSFLGGEMPRIGKRAAA
jgi:hypothetical protein